MLKLASIIIAAGNSSRLGQPKQLIKLNNQTLISRITQIALSTTHSTTCILGANVQQISPLINNSRVNILLNQQWPQGMGTSIALGISQLPSQTDAAMILLSDQWLLTIEDIKQLIKQWNDAPEKIIASQYYDEKRQQETLGAPVIFPKKYFPALQQLRETGAKKLLQQLAHHVVKVPLSNAAFDLDTPEDLKHLVLYQAQMNKIKTENHYDKTQY
ncbi:nucleotidyltransferase family protein [Aliikangiella sp. IMCC44359]|uniref:nucleotidyltransferase family protein n=1 Tax=Aliikangiella sp. IMCC44359 TaxID=3459125 RepID=UPI00403A88BB